MLDRLITHLAPHSCCGCGNVGSLLCDSCKYDIISEPYGRCLNCGTVASHDDLCPTCRSSLRLAGAWVVGSRDGTLKRLLDRYKFGSAIAASHDCADLLASRLPVLPVDTVVVAVPTIPAHVRSRGFDHTAAIARSFAARRRLSYQRVLARHGGGTQHLRSRRERFRWAAEGLRVTGPVPETILLIDDIYTTGATAAACSTALRQAGAHTVYVAVLARQELV